MLGLPECYNCKNSYQKTREFVALGSLSYDVARVAAEAEAEAAPRPVRPCTAGQRVG